MLSGLALSSCGWTLAEVKSDVGDVSDHQPASNELYIYTWSSYFDDELLDGFQKQTGIKVIADTFESNEVMLATLRAGKGAAYSVIYPSDYTVAKMISLKMLRELDRSRLPGLSNLLPRFQNSITDPGNRYHVPFSWGTTGFTYDSEQLSPGPDGWSYLWQTQDKLSRRMTLMSDLREVMGGVLRSIGYSYNSTNPAEIQQAYEKLVQLKPQIVTFNTDAWRDQLIAGDLVLSMGFSSDALTVMSEDARLRYVIPATGTSVWSDTLVIPKTAPNPKAAYAWINYLLEPAIAAKVTERLLFATPNQAAYEQLPAALQKNEVLFPPESVLARCEGIVPVSSDTEALYERYWTQLVSS
ncbi:spermidine/putrescine ABC transporter substrate-binding protein [Leptolyngbya sp. FACHB-36]|nr:spermidine/putrescine ABC transporter substrate-binding protein [Leptolyngbya sp. FACHB-36]MBD2021868.1 spermidine/putrescine ABC transporter substrate-binding protein [Leptolyngbya sp. FACHB-36]